MPDTYQGQLGSFVLGAGFSAATPALVLPYTPHNVKSNNYSSGLLQIGWTVSGSLTLGRTGFNFQTDTHNAESYETYNDAGTGAFALDIQLVNGTGGGWVAQGTANITPWNFWNNLGATANLAVWNQSNNGPGSVAVTFNRVTMFLQGEAYHVPSRLSPPAGILPVRSMFDLGLDMLCLKRKGGAYLSIPAAGVNLPAAWVVDLGGQTEAQFLKISPGLFNNAGSGGNAGLGIRVYRGLPAAGSIQPGKWNTGYSGIGTPELTLVGTLPEAAKPWGGPLQFVIEIVGTGNIPAASTFDLTVEGYDL